MFGQNPIHRIYAADSPGIAERKDSRHVTIEDKQASFDQPNSRQFKTLANKNELAPVNGVLYLVRSERFNESRRKVAAEIVRRLIHRDYNNDIGDLGGSRSWVSHSTKTPQVNTSRLGSWLFGGGVERYGRDVV